MKYERVEEGRFLERPNRFIAYVEIAGKIEKVHVKNTGRCRELLVPGVEVYLQKAEELSENKKTAEKTRKTQWDLIGVNKGGNLVNMDSQIPNKVVKEWIEKGNLFSENAVIYPEKTYGNSRFDLYIEDGEKKAFIEVKGVTLEENQTAKFPDAPSERAIKHVEELIKAKKAGYETYVFFVIQMKNIRYFTPNDHTHQAFADVLEKAARNGVNILAYDCNVKKDAITLRKKIPVVLKNEILKQLSESIVDWFRENKRQLPWRETKDPYKIWISEIMLQQTRVEAVKPFYERFLKELPDIHALAEAPEEKLLKLWEGLGYYNRIRNMQKAAKEMEMLYDGTFPRKYQEIRNLTGIGNYTAGAISSFAFDIAKPAVDGNVLRVVSRILGSQEDIMKQSVRERIEDQLELVIPKDAASDFNQGLIELGAIVCVPNGMPKCEICPARNSCKAKKENMIDKIPVKKKAKKRKVEKRTVLIFKDGEKTAIKKRPKKGLLAGLYELPNLSGHLTQEEIIAYSKEIGLMPVRVEKLADAKHIFSHVEWQMIGYAIRVDELEKSCKEEMIFIHPQEIEQKYPIPAAFESYTKYMNIRLGQEKYKIDNR